MGNMKLLTAGAEFVGWFEAPFPFGKTEFQLKITSVNPADRSFTGTGNDKQGNFTVGGTLFSDDEVEFVKDYVDGSHTGVKYKGRVEGKCIAGEYKFNYKKMFINMDICENFWMELINNKEM